MYGVPIIFFPKWAIRKSKSKRKKKKSHIHGNKTIIYDLCEIHKYEIICRNSKSKMTKYEFPRNANTLTLQVNMMRRKQNILKVV